MKKFGPQRTQMMQAHLAQVGKQVGIDFGFSGKTGNTRDSHRLIQLAKTKGPEMQERSRMPSLFLSRQNSEKGNKSGSGEMDIDS